jgi:hypothetical protein
MRLRVAITGAACALLWTASAMAMYTPNPAGRWAPERFTLAGDFQFNSSKGLDHAPDADNVAGFFVRPSYSIIRNLVVYARLGFQTADNVDTGFAGGFGVQGAYVLPGAREWAIGGAFDFLHWSGDFPSGAPVQHDIDWNEFQLAPAVSYNIPRVPQLTPYAGMLFDFVDARDSVSESDPVGILFGTNWDPTPEVRLDAQFRGVNETGFFFSVAYIFP